MLPSVSTPGCLHCFYPKTFYPFILPLLHKERKPKYILWVDLVLSVVNRAWFPPGTLLHNVSCWFFLLRWAHWGAMPTYVFTLQWRFSQVTKSRKGTPPKKNKKNNTVHRGQLGASTLQLNGSNP